MPRPRSERAADNVVPVRLTDAELAILDGLRLPGESRSGVIRRLLDRVAYAEQVALAEAGEAAPPLPGDPRAPAAHGSTSVVFPPRLQTGQRWPEYLDPAVVDTRSGVTLHKPQRAEGASASLVVAGPRDQAGAILDHLEGGRGGGRGLREELLRGALSRMGAGPEEIERVFAALGDRARTEPLADLVREAVRVLGY